MYKIVAKGNHRDMQEIEKSIFSGQFGKAVKDLKVYENSGNHKQALKIHKMFYENMGDARSIYRR